MASLLERAKDLWQAAQHGRPNPPSLVVLPVTQVDQPLLAAPVLQLQRNYFEVRINQMYLAYQREWFKTYDPMVFVVSEFTYGTATSVLPFVVGPSIMEKHGRDLPSGMMFFDTKVAGLHPYRGGQLNLAVILYQVQTDDYAKKLLGLVENAARVLDFASALGTYTKVASILLDGIEALTGLQGTRPVVGVRKELDPARKDVGSGYFVLVDAPSIDWNKIRVQDERLYWEDNGGPPRPFQDVHDSDFVLYSVGQRPTRDDLSVLPFYPLWEEVVREASVPGDAAWNNAKANMAVLYQAMVLSPDLTLAQARDQAAEWRTTMKLLHDDAVANVNMGEETPAGGPSELDDLRSQIADILRM